MSTALLLLAPLFPFVLALAGILPAGRRAAPRLLWLAPLPGLLVALFVPLGTEAAGPAPMRLTLALDGPGALLLGASSLLWMAAGAYAAAYLKDDPRRPAFSLWWLLTLAGSQGVFLVADFASFYLAFSLLSLAAYGMTTHRDTAEARHAGAVYLTLTVVSEAFVLFALVALAAGSADANPRLDEVASLLPASPYAGAILVSIICGFGLKMGLVPLHVWMPLAHSAAPVPAATLSSGILVKAGVIGLLRFLPLDMPTPGFGMALLAMGLLTAFYGVVVGLAQSRPKTILAYSTVSQMGVIGAVAGAALAAGAAEAAAPIAFYGANHVLLKGGMFLAIGVMALGGPSAGRVVPAVTALLCLSLAGLPFSGGALAKYAVKDFVGGGWAGFLFTLSGAGTLLLTARFVLVLSRTAPVPGAAGRAAVIRVLAGAWGLVSLAGLVLPYLLYPGVTGSSLSAAFGWNALADAAWPVALGAIVAAGLYLRPLPVPEVPPGDILALVERGKPLLAPVMAAGLALDGQMRRWPVAGIALALVALALVLAMRAA